MGNLLVPFKKFLSNKNTITILGVLIGVVVLYLGYNWRVNKSIQPVQIPQATQTMFAGSKIIDGSYKLTSVPKDLITKMPNLITKREQLANKIVAYNSTIAINGFFFTENILDETEVPSSIFAYIPDGYTIYRMEVDNKKTYGNSILPDTKIDLYMSTTVQEDDNKPVYGRFIKSINVLAVRDKDGKDVFLDKDNPSEAALLLFAVPENLFLLLKKCEKLGIELEPVPRNESYTKNPSATELTSDDLQAMVINKTHILPNECTDLTICG